MSKIWRELENCRFVPVNMRNLDELSEKEPGAFVAAPQAQLVQPQSVESEQSNNEIQDSETCADGQVVAESPAEPEIDIEALEKEAYEKGLAEGKAQTEKKLAQATKAVSDAAKKLSTQSETIMRRSADDMLELVMAIAERVIHIALDEHKDAIVKIVQQTIDAAVQAEEFHIRVNPDDVQVLNEHKPLFIASLSGLRNIEFIADGSLSRGGCMLDSPSGRVDATLETQLNEIFSHLKEIMGQGK